MGLSNLLFIAFLGVAIFFFSKKIKSIIRNVQLGRKLDRTDKPSERLRTMLLVAFGQSKMVTKPIAGFFHILIYIGFVIINLEVAEIVIDGIFGTHRIFSFLGGLYDTLIASFEILALLVLIACVVFFARRNVLHIPRFRSIDLKGWAFNDANIILVIEVLLMTAFLTMNAADYILQSRGVEHYVQAGSYPISATFLAPLLSNFSDGALIGIERACWWFHILGILGFLNYLPYSKHFHIVLAFPNTYYSNLEAKGRFNNMESVTNEVKLMFDPSASAPAAGDTPSRFGAKDVNDLTWKQLLDSYSCTECGRCTSECPANQTGKKLSPRAIMMKTRDRLEEVGKSIDLKGSLEDDGKSLLFDYITPEEVWACTSCNACVEACPVNIDPLSIIIDLRRFLVMEQSAAPTELNNMFTNIENNGAPWQFSPADRFNWANEA